MSIQVRLFGSPSFCLADQWLPLPLDKRGALLAMLAHSEEGWSRSRLAKLFWPTTSTGHGRVNLRALLARLRTLDIDADLSLVGERLAWHVTCDSREFRVAMREERWLDATSLSTAPLLRDMDLLETHEVSTWIDLERQDLEASYRLAVVRAADLLAGIGDLPRVVDLWRTAFERASFDEVSMESCLRLALRHAELSATALRLNDKFAARLNADFGIAPSTDLERLAQQLRSDVSAGTRLTDSRITADNMASLPAIGTAKQRRLPAPVAPLVNRELEVAEIADLIRLPYNRAVVIVGPGGIGKTQLALQVARQLEASSRDGCWFVPLAGIESVELCAAEVARVVGVHLHGPASATSQLLAYFRDRVTLLVLDNLEQLPGSGAFIDGLLAHAPGLRILSTSRSPLPRTASTPFDLDGMPYPEDALDDRFNDYTAVRLFTMRARQTEPRFTLSEADRSALLAICRSVGGAPLGIELAAAWVGVLALGDIAEALEAGSNELDREFLDAPVRHRSLKAAFDHSWRLLNDTERRTTAALSVFVGGFTAEAAEQVTGCGPSVLATLLGWSLISRAGEGRFDLHQLVRQFAANELKVGAQEEAAVRRRHANYYTGLVEREGRHLKGGTSQVRALEVVANDLRNVRAAWAHALAERDDEALEKLLPMVHVFEIKGLYQVGLEAFAQSAAALPQWSIARARSLTAQSVLLGRVGRLEECRATVDQSLAILNSQDAYDGLTLLHLGVIEYLEGNVEAAGATWNRLVNEANKFGDSWSKAGAVSNLNVVARHRGDADTALAHVREGLELAEELHDIWGLNLGLVTAGEIALDLGDLVAADTYLRKALESARSIEQRPMVWEALLGLGMLAKQQGDAAAAIARFRECAATAKADGDESTLAIALKELHEMEGSQAIVPS